VSTRLPASPRPLCAHTPNPASPHLLQHRVQVVVAAGVVARPQQQPPAPRLVQHAQQRGALDEHLELVPGKREAACLGCRRRRGARVHRPQPQQAHVAHAALGKQPREAQLQQLQLRVARQRRGAHQQALHVGGVRVKAQRQRAAGAGHAQRRQVQRLHRAVAGDANLHGGQALGGGRPRRRAAAAVLAVAATTTAHRARQHDRRARPVVEPHARRQHLRARQREVAVPAAARRGKRLGCAADRVKQHLRRDVTQRAVHRAQRRRGLVGAHVLESEPVRRVASDAR
jgi:hypothetical protein